MAATIKDFHNNLYIDFSKERALMPMSSSDRFEMTNDAITPSIVNNVSAA